MADPAASLAVPLVRERRIRPGLVDLYLIRGVAGPFLLVTLAVGAAMMLERALRLIHELAARGADLAYFFPILAQLIPYYLDLALPAAFMVALVLLIARLDDNLELEAMLAAGLSLTRIVLPLAAFGLLIAAAGLAAGGWLEPHGQYGMRSLRAEAVNAARIGRLEPGAFYHPADSLALTFDERDSDGTAGNVFLWQRLADGRELVVTARSARIGFAPQRGWFGLELRRGRYIADRPASAAPEAVAFDSLAFRESLRLEETSSQRGWDPNELTLTELAAALRSGDTDIAPSKLAAELYGRIARAALIPLIPFLVLPLAFTTKKGRRGLGILLALVLLSTFHHGMNLARHLAFADAVAAGPAILAATALYAAVAMLVFAAGRQLPSRGPIHSLLKRIPDALARRRPGTARVGRLPGRTLAAYLGWRLAGWTFAALLGVVLLLQMVDLLERGGEFIERDLGFSAVAYHALLQLPLMLQQAMPVAALAGAMTVFAGLARAREMTAIRAAGVSQWRIMLMALPVPLLLSASTFFLSEHVVPRSQVALAAWWTQTQSAVEVPEDSARWFRIGGEIVQARGAAPDGRVLERVEIFRRDRSGLLVERLSAARATAGADGWTLHEVERSRFGGRRMRRERSAQLEWRAPLQPDDVTAFFSSARSLSSAAARRALGEEAPVSQSDTLFATRIMRSAAEPLAPIVMLLLALPLAFVAPRTGTAWPAFLYAAGGGLLYLVADGVLTVTAQVGMVPATIGAWTAPVLGLLGGLCVLVYAER